MTEEFEDWHYRTGLSVNDLREQRRAFWERSHCASLCGLEDWDEDVVAKAAAEDADLSLAEWDKRWGPGGKEPGSATEAKR